MITLPIKILLKIKKVTKGSTCFIPSVEVDRIDPRVLYLTELLIWSSINDTYTDNPKIFGKKYGQSKKI